jgi:hypothetical protein
MVPRLGSQAATDPGQVPCAVAVADQGVYLRGDDSRFSSRAQWVKADAISATPNWRADMGAHSSFHKTFCVRL